MNHSLNAPRLWDINLILPDNITETAIVLKDRYFDLKGLSAYSALAEPTLRDHIKKNRLPAFKVKGKILVRRSEFDTWVEAFRINRTQDIKKIANDVMRDFRAKSDRQSEGQGV